jgi:phosphatidylglycerophosphate synthase
VARVALVPVFIATALRVQQLARDGGETGDLRRTLLVLLVIMALSDAADGWLARRHGLASQAGAIVDAVSDKLAQVALVTFFTFSDGPPFVTLPVWFFAAVLGRDLILGGGWLLLRLRHVPVEVVHELHGRASLVAVFVVLFWVTIGLPAGGLEPVLLVAVAVIAASIASYVIDTNRGGPP